MWGVSFVTCHLSLAGRGARVGALPGDGWQLTTDNGALTNHTLI